MDYLIGFPFQEISQKGEEQKSKCAHYEMFKLHIA